MHVFSYPYLKFIFIGFSIPNGTSCEICMKLNLLTTHPGFRDSVPCDGSVCILLLHSEGGREAHFVPYFLGQEQCKLFSGALSPGGQLVDS